MRILLDHCTPAKLVPHLAGHVVVTTAGKGWDTLQNGELLLAAEAEFDLFITCDGNIRYQQNLSARRIAILELGVQKWPLLQLRLSEICAAVEAISPGEYRVLF